MLVEIIQVIVDAGLTMNDHHMVKVLKFFDGSTKKTINWYNDKNLHLNGVPPIDMIRKGKLAKLNKYIDECLDEGWAL